jgi:hypothetical protein
VEQSSPVQLVWQLQLPSTPQVPWPVHSLGQLFTAQLSPIQPVAQSQRPVVKSHWPLPLHWSSGLTAVQPGHWWTRQSSPVNMSSQAQVPFKQAPWLLQPAGHVNQLQSLRNPRRQPSSQWQCPSVPSQFPWPLQLLPRAVKSRGDPGFNGKALGHCSFSHATPHHPTEHTHSPVLDWHWPWWEQASSGRVVAGTEGSIGQCCSSQLAPKKLSKHWHTWGDRQCVWWSMQAAVLTQAPRPWQSPTHCNRSQANPTNPSTQAHVPFWQVPWRSQPGAHSW